MQVLDRKSCCIPLIDCEKFSSDLADSSKNHFLTVCNVDMISIVSILGEWSSDDERTELGLQVSSLGLGCLELSHKCYGNTLEEEEGIAVIHHAYNKGVTSFDPSDLYGPHSIEKVIGKVLHASYYTNLVMNGCYLLDSRTQKLLYFALKVIRTSFGGRITAISTGLRLQLGFQMASQTLTLLNLGFFVELLYELV